MKQADALCAYLKCLKNSRPEIMNSCWQKRDWKRRLKRVAGEEMDYFMEIFVPASIFRSMRLARIHRCKQPESASHQAISAGCDIGLS
ncbi:YfbR-like 5'-deoxynucleotidase [Escherichia coli]